jgi:hypothetical protein
MTSRIIRDAGDLARLVTFLEARKLPLTVSIAAGIKRTDEQNKLQRKWCGEIAQQMGDRTAEEVRGYCKLTMGVPILRAENDAFAEKYDRLIKPRTYEEKLELMMEPLDFPITRLMTTKQKTQFLDAMHRYWSAKGLMLTTPEAAQ